MVLIEKENSPLCGVFKKTLIILIMFVLLGTPTALSFNINSLETGNREYVIESNLGIYEESFNLDVEAIANEKVAELSKNAEISNWNFDSSGFLQETSSVNNPTNNKKTLTEQVKSHVDITYNQYELKILKDGSIYYFKTEQEANSFKEQIGEEVEISKTEVRTLDNITTKEVLDKKIAKLKEEKEAETIRVASVTSRSGINRKSNSGTLPIVSYSYISSYYRSASRPSHTGVDFAATKGTSILAYKSGTVTRASWNGSYGMCIEIQHSNGEKTRYAHCSGYNVSVGQTVSQGQVIGYVGSTGNSTGPHLHFEIMINGSFVNPLNYI